MMETLDARVEASSGHAAWCYTLLENLDEFAMLAWYLVADSRLVEITVMRTMARLESIPYEASTAAMAESQVRETLIAEALAALEVERRQAGEELQVGVVEFPDVPRLALLLKLVLQLSEGEVRRLVEVKPGKAGQMVKRALDRLGLRIPVTGMLGLHDA